MLIETKLGELLRMHGLKLSCAESCTGGLLSNRITNVPGSSEYFPGGVVTYSYEAKESLLGVPWDLLNSVGAVSEEVVREMARGVRRLFAADIGVSVSGIAGPSGGTVEKPVGTTWFGLVAPQGEWARHFVWEGDREQNKFSSTEAAMQFVVDYLEGRLK